MTSRIALAAFALLAGCHTSQINTRAEAQIDVARASAEAKMVYGSCDMRVTVPCGLIMKLVSTDHYRTAFRDKFCASKSKEACQESYQRMIDAALAKRYWAADWNGVARHCALHPNACEDGVDYEKLLLSSHNAMVQQKYAEDVDRIEAEREAAHRADTAASIATAHAVLGTVAELSGKRVCRTYPSLLGGFTTVCSR